jgi:SAM-dependent methyltransferase
MEDLAVEPWAYDLVVSRLALHYVRDYEAVLRTVHGDLRDRGQFIFSVEHPVCTALCAGWYEDDHGGQVFWPVDNYSAEGERRQKWFVDGVIKYHRTIATYVNGLLQCGFALTRLLEPHAVPESLEGRPDLQGTLRRPAVLIIAATKLPGCGANAGVAAARCRSATVMPILQPQGSIHEHIRHPGPS